MSRPLSQFIIDTDEDFLKKAFETIDKNDDGFLCDDEIDTFFKDVGMPVNEEELNNFKMKIKDSSRGDLSGKCVFQVSIKVSVLILFHRVTSGIKL